MRFIAAVFTIFSMHFLNAAELGNIEDRVLAFETRAAAAEGFSLDRDTLLNICSGLEGARWCEGYVAAVLAALHIPRNSDCLPITDMAPFMYGNIWELTQNWLYEHPEILEITLLDAILNALKEQEQCKF